MRIAPFVATVVPVRPPPHPRPRPSSPSRLAIALVDDVAVTSPPTTQATAESKPSVSVRSAVKLAVRTVAAVTRNAFVSSLVAWTAAFALSRGNIFHVGRDPQSHIEFLTALLLWGDLFFSTGMLVARSSSLWRLHFVSKPSHMAGAKRVLPIVFLRTWHVQLVVGAAMIGIGQLTRQYSSPSLRRFRLELYLSMAVNHPYTTWVDVVARRIYKQETVEGQQAATRRKLRLEAAVSATKDSAGTSRATTTSVHRFYSLRSSRAASTRVLGSASSTAAHPSSLTRWQRAMEASTQNLPPLLCIVSPTLYVHAISQSQSSTASVNVVLFTAVSLFVKVVMQEIAKFYILKRKTSNLRSMAVVVVIPTIMIDTQMRLVLMREQSNSTTLSGLVLLAVVEIAMRAFKLVTMHLHIKHKQRKLAIVSVGLEAEEQLVYQAEFDAWQSRVKQYHIAEVSADMYAEYLAIGCSYAIVFFFRDHPHFALGFNASPQPNGASSASTGTGDVLTHALFGRSQVLVLVLQIVMELVVDCVSCFVEILKGRLDFESLERDRLFYIIFFVTLAVLNIYVSSVLYLRSE